MRQARQLTKGEDSLLYLLRTVFLFDERQQVGLVIEGVGGSGKSTFIDLIRTALCGKSKDITVNTSSQAVVYMSPNKLSSRFETHALTAARLIVFGDISSEPINKECTSILRSLISLNSIRGEIKGGVIYTVEPCGKVIIDTNYPFSTLDEGFGLSRRLITIETPRRARRPNPLLLDLLTENLSGIINWVLRTPKEIRFLHGSVEDINFALSSSNTSTLDFWIQENLAPDPRERILLGATKAPVPNSLYESYSRFADKYEEDPIPPTKFSSSVLDKLRALGCPATLQKLEQGRFIKGINWKHKCNNKFPKTNPDLLSNLGSLVPLDMPASAFRGSSRPNSCFSLL